MRYSFRIIMASTFCSAVLVACGGGGGDSSTSVTPPCDVATKTCYVSPDGNDTNSGAAADPASALRQISKAAQIAFDGYTIIVAPGRYTGDIKPRSTGNAQQGLHFIAQETQGLVIVDVGSGTAGFSFGNSNDLAIDGFTIIGGTDAGIVIKSGSDNAQIRNCSVSGGSSASGSDGIRVQDSSNVLVFDNLIYENTGIGIRIAGNSSGSPDARIINNTVYGNGARGIEIGTTTKESPRAFVFNNIIQNNSATLESIKVQTAPRSDLGYVGDFNAVLPNKYLPTAIKGTHDRHQDVMFVGDFHLSPASDAIDRGDALNGQQADDPLTGQPVALSDLLHARTTTGSARDTATLDIGYHYPF